MWSSWGGIVDEVVNTSSEFIWGLITAGLFTPIARADLMEADFIAESFPIEVDTVKMSTEVLSSKFSEVVDELLEFGLGPLLEWE